MKKVFLILGVMFILLILAAGIIPFIFKDEVKKRIDKALAENVNAEVYYDADQFGLNLFSNFPNATLTLGDFGVANRVPFEGDTLLDVKSLRFVINIVSVIKGENIKIDAIELDQPKIHVKVLEDGQANYDIAVKKVKEEEKEEKVEEEEEAPKEVSFQVNHWAIKQGQIIYDDRSSKLLTALVGVNHQGKGDFTQQIFDIVTQTTIDNLSVKYEGTEFLSNKSLDANITMNMDMDQMKCTFKDNRVKLNEFAFSFEGFSAMHEDDLDLDISFKAEKTNFKDLLSLVPMAYMKGFEDIKAEGNVAFDGFVKGAYNSEKDKMPAYQLKVLVDKGQFQFKKVPKPVRNVNVDLLVDNKSGKFENTLFNIKKFHADLGNNPFDARLLIEGLGKMKVDGQIDTEIDLEELTSMFPLEDMTLKGKYKLHAKANGVYDTLRSIIPRIDAVMSLEDGYVKTKDFPIPLENIFVDATAKNTSGRMAETVLNISDFEFELEGEKMVGNLKVENLDDYTWDMNVKGDVDLAKITKIYPLDSMTVAGRLHADINTKGKMSDLEAERYDRLPTKGKLDVRDFSFTSYDLPQGFRITKAKAVFDPQRITLRELNGFLGKSDIQIKGYLSNYLAYTLKERAVIKGKMDFKSKTFDLNEWMEEEPKKAATQKPKKEEEPHLQAYEVPKNIDFVLNARIQKVLYSDLTMNNMTGKVVVKNGVIRLENGKYQLAGGDFGLAGMYDSRNIKRPKFDFDFNIRNMTIANAYNSFDVVKKFAPIAGRMNGNFTTDFDLAGDLKQDMTPEYNTLNGNGVISIKDASLKGSKLLRGILMVTKLSDANEMNLKDVDIQAEIKNGRVFVKPFEMSVGSYMAKIGGSQGVDGTLDYTMDMTVPAEKLGSQLGGLISGYLGGGKPTDVILKLGIKGTSDNPKVSILGTNFVTAGEEGEPADTTTLKEKAKEEAEKRAQEEAEKLKKKAKEKLKKLFGDD
ncbi:AsmA family protein [Xanthovirga aplysinae]|uniref:AsmA family protein n=1 Tax=Xanthovirga aplysinae TaxID=2529853 RepID=UPI0012BC8166|nr:AsmA-like C-terminal region-containing protein [Xanthovirga aplysinae]MTI30452.1 AsmA family protein [Xanthovirga aplysinae]